MICSIRRTGRSLWALLFIVTLATFVLITGCGSSSTRATSATTTKPERTPVEDLEMQASDFRNLRDMTPVRGFFIDNRLGHLDEALEIARANRGGKYPVGTIIQLVPQEAMVKRARDFSPGTGDWEFFFLTTDATGTTIAARGTTEVVNRFGGNCFSCHTLAEDKFDLVCEQDHGCDPLPIGDDVIRGIQATDPRPRAPS